MVLVVLLFFNWGEYCIYKFFGYYKYLLGWMFYKCYIGDYYSFFVVGQMCYEQVCDWWVILFLVWLVVVFSFGVLFVWSLFGLLNDNFVVLFVVILLLGYFSYEIFYVCEYLLLEYLFSCLLWICYMCCLYELYYCCELMQMYNFNLVFLLMDWCYGIFYWEVEIVEEYVMICMQY